MKTAVFANLFTLATFASFAFLPAASAFAVQTVDCPDRIHARITDLHPDLTADPNDPDLELIQEAYAVLSRRHVISAHGALQTRDSGRCEYESTSARLVIYTKGGHDILMAEIALTAQASVRVYARIKRMAPEVFKLERQARYGMMASFNSLPNGHYDGGPAVQSLGYAKSFETSFKLEAEDSEL